MVADGNDEQRKQLSEADLKKEQNKVKGGVLQGFAANGKYAGNIPGQPAAINSLS